MNCVLYLRMSTDRTGEAQGIDRQRTDCKRLAEQRGWKVSCEIVDNDVSASFGTRPGFEELLRVMESGQTDAVVVWHIDRLLRKMTDLERVIEIVERTGVKLATFSGDIDLSNDMGRMVGRILASVSRAEVERKSARQKAANAQRAAQGLPYANKRCYGYLSDGVTVYEPEATVLREMAASVLAGKSYKDVARALNASGIQTTQGNIWHSVSVRNILHKKRYAGIREHKGAEYPAVWQPIFDNETWERLQLTMRMRSEKAVKPRMRKYLLTGLAHCGKCGAPLTGAHVRDRSGRPKQRVYNCRGRHETLATRIGCGGVRRDADCLDHFIREAVVYRLESPELAALLSADNPNDAQLRELLAARKAQVARQTALVDDYATGVLSKAQFQRANLTAKNELARLEREIDSLQGKRTMALIPAGQTVREAWMSCNSDAWRRQLIELLIKKITVNAGNTKPYYFVDGKRHRFDPALIEIEWLH